MLRESAAEFERPVLLFSGGKDSIVLLRLAEKAFRPGGFPFPVMHVDTGHNFPEAIEFRDRRIAEIGERLIVASVQESIEHGRVDRRDRPARVAQRPADRDPAGCDRRARLRCRVRRRPPRRGARAGQGADPVLPRRVRPVGAEGAAAGAVEPLQRAHPQGRARARVPDLQLDRARRVAVHRRGGARGALDLLRPRTRGVRARRDAVRDEPARAARGGRAAVPGLGALPHGGRHDVYGGGRVDRPPRLRKWCSRSPRRRSPSAARRAPTTGSPRRRWRTASARATSDGDLRPSPESTGARRRARRGRSHRRLRAAVRAPRGTAALRHRGLGGRRQEHADRAAAVRLQAGARRPARARRAGQQADGLRLPRPVPADRRSARRARAGHHDRRRLPLLRDGPAPLHHRRHAGARAVHAQHGHRRLDRRPGDRA